MRLKTWPVAALGLGSLVVLIVVSMFASSRKAQDIYGELDRLNSHHQRVDAYLRHDAPQAEAFSPLGGIR